MIKLDLIELADLTAPKEIANEIIQQNPDISLPIPLEEIAEKSGICDIDYKPLDRIEGALVANDTKSQGIIIINDHARHHRQRFTLGHELGHFLIPRHGANMQCSVADLLASDRAGIVSELKIESEANLLSAELLMPERIFKAMPEFRSEPSIESIRALSEKFDVSFEACANRYVALHDYPVAVVFNYRDKVRYGQKSSELPLWLKCFKGDQVPSRSATKSVDLNKSNSVDSFDVRSDIWFDESRSWKSPETVIEEVYVQENLYSTTLLWFDDEIEEVE